MHNAKNMGNRNILIILFFIPFVVFPQKTKYFKLTDTNVTVGAKYIFTLDNYYEWPDNPDQLKADSIVSFLNNNPSIKVEISSHSDYRGSEEYNDSLTNRRAKSLKNYFIEKGIDEKRVIAIGYGSKKPRVVDKTISKKYKFLRRKQILDKEYILKLKKTDEQKIANSINRRFELTIIE
jgi:outer membrane protein OmpA-like peptidoglycan-associated protein